MEKEKRAQDSYEERMKKECTFIPNTQLTKQKNQKVLSRGSPRTIAQ
jgi:hypothetical protein